MLAPLPNIEAVVAIPQQPQVQSALNSQLESLRVAANRLGLYDAADHLRLLLERAR